MKNTISILALAILFIACGAGNQQREALEEVSREWDKTYALVNAFVDRAETEQISWQEQYERMELTEEELNLLDEQTRIQLIEIKTTCREHGAVYDQVAEAVETFAIRWEEQTGELKMLNQQLLEGKTPTNLEEKTNAFQSTLSEVDPKLSNWAKQLDLTFESCQQTCRHFEKLASGEVE